MVHRVPEGGDFQAALDHAKPGDRIVLTAGALYPGPFTLPRKDGDRPITVESSALRFLKVPRWVEPADARYMPRLVAPGRNEPALRTAPGAHHWRLRGLQVCKASAAAAASDLVLLGDGGPAQDRLEVVPHHITLDRCLIHGEDEGELKRGVALNGAHLTVTGCWIGGCQATVDAQALCGWNGPGPFRITRCYLEATGENVMFGGEDPWIKDLVPAGIRIEACHLVKPLRWRGTWAVKNLLELKNARNVNVTRCFLENCWLSGQTGYAIVLTSVNQNDRAPWSEVAGVEFRENWIARCGGGVNLAGHYWNSGPVRNVRFVGNTFAEIDGAEYGGHGRWLQVTDAEDLTCDHNTVQQSGHILTLYGEKSRNLTLTNNLCRDGGLFGDGDGTGEQALNTYCLGYHWEGNAVVGGRREEYPPGTLLPRTFEEAATAGFARLGTDGRDVGSSLRWWPA